MNAPTYFDEDHNAASRPAIAISPAPPRPFCSCVMAFVRICLTGPGARVPRLVISPWVTEWPARPTRETITSMPGKIDRTA